MEPCSREGNKAQPMARRIRLLMVVASLTSACATHDDHKPPASRSIVADVIVTVDNQTSRAVMIYLESGVIRDSLGVVPRRSLRSFSMPSTVGDSMSALRLEARERRTVPGLRSDAFHLSSGHQVVWTLDRTRSGALTMH
jgi:hypothetical protein